MDSEGQKQATQLRQQLDEALLAISTTTVGEIFPNEKLRTDLRELCEWVATCAELARYLRSVSWLNMPPLTIHDFLTVAHGASRSLDAWRLLVNDQTKSARDVHSIIQEQWNSSFTPRVQDNEVARLRTFVSAARSQAGLLVLVQGDQGVEERNKRLDEEYRRVQAYAGQVQELASSTADAAQKWGASKHSKKFDDVAGRHETVGGRWLVSSFAFYVLAMAASFCFTLKLEAKYDERIVPIVLQKLEDGNPRPPLPWWVSLAPEVFTVSTLAGLGFFAGRQHRAHRHLHAVNDHKATSLATFQTFVNAADAASPDIKNAILRDCTSAIFALGDTGYQSKGEGAQSGGIVEVVRCNHPQYTV